MSQTNKSCGQVKRRLIALSFLLCFAIASLSATIFIITQADHECIGEACTVCVLIHNAQKLLDRIGKAVTGILIFAGGLFTAIHIWAKRGHLFSPYHLNLVSVKTRLNN